MCVRGCVRTHMHGNLTLLQIDAQGHSGPSLSLVKDSWVVEEGASWPSRSR